LERFVEGEPEVDRFAKYAEQKLRVELDQDAIRFILLRVTEERPTEGPNVDDPLQRAGLKALSAEMIADCVIQAPLAEDVCDGPLFIVPELLQHRVEVFKRLTWFFVIDTCGIKIHQQEQLKVV
jgi:hypothetical protein